MFGNRRVPPHLVLAFSVLLGALCGAGAFFAFRSGSWVWAGLAGVLAVWFVVDAVRAYSWVQNSKRQTAPAAGQRR
ncbi:hypothetical protein [Deinococcus aerophilus]|uniref:DUF4175 domain-containing protein n=1 Tax=Deinococcus aerophilus TaxID=522488 RepID=A0ABQ2GYB7_9DEIO|nr:hypothetical protein [Deinococcus aerophilus]GGM17938.1 hypothetical protein GCM10010841_27630 [Deinococcus aerophilus]